MAWKPIHPSENASKVAINTLPWDIVQFYNKTDFEEQGFSRTKRAKQSQRESVSVLRTAPQLNITVAILQEMTHAAAHVYTHSQTIRMHTIVHKCTLNISQVKAFIPLC